MEESRGLPIGKCTRTRISHDNCITALVNGYLLVDEIASLAKDFWSPDSFREEGVGEA